MSGLEDTFGYYIHCLAPDLEPGMKAQHRIGPERKYRFDFAWEAARVGVELHGGIWSRGAHARPQGIQRDMHKANYAALEGWTVLYFSTDDLEDDPAEVMNVIREVLKRRAA